MPRIVVMGYYGFGNEGDEAILRGLRKAVDELRPGTQWVVTSGHPADTEGRHGVQALPWKETSAIAAAIAASDLVLVGGGGLLQDHWGCHLATLFTPDHANVTFYGLGVVLAAMHAKPAALFAVGVGPLTTTEGRGFVRALVEAATSVSVRDRGSQDTLVLLGIPRERVLLAADPVFALPPPTPIEDVSCERIGVSVRDWRLGPASSVWESQLVAGLDQFMEASPEAQLLFVPFQVGSRDIEDDLACSERIRAQLRHPERTSLLPLSDQLDPSTALAGCRVVLGMRLHAVLFAMAAGRPVVGLAYDPKVASVLREAGRAECVIGLEELGRRDLGRTLADARPAEAGHIANLRRRARLAAEHAIEGMESRRPACFTKELGAMVSEAWQAQVAEREGLRVQLASQAGTLEQQRALFELQRGAQAEAHEAEKAALSDRVERLMGEHADQRSALEARLRQAELIHAQLQTLMLENGRHLEAEQARVIAERDHFQRRSQDLHAEMARLRSTRGFRVLQRYWALATPVRRRLLAARRGWRGERR